MLVAFSKSCRRLPGDGFALREMRKFTLALLRCGGITSTCVLHRPTQYNFHRQQFQAALTTILDLPNARWVLIYLRKNRYQPGGPRSRAHFLTVVIHEGQIEKMFDVRNETMEDPVRLDQFANIMFMVGPYQRADLYAMTV